MGIYTLLVWAYICPYGHKTDGGKHTKTEQILNPKPLSQKTKRQKKSAKTLTDDTVATD
jgi:hypothetical protein